MSTWTGYTFNRSAYESRYGVKKPIKPPPTTRSEIIQRIPQSIKDLVSGFIRDSTKELINDDIISICLLFADPNKDDFNQQLSHHKLTIDNNESIMKLSDGYIARSTYNGYLNNIVSKGKHYWRFKCIDLKCNQYAMRSLIGIFNTKYEHKDTSWYGFVCTEDDSIQICTGYAITTDGYSWMVTDEGKLQSKTLKLPRSGIEKDDIIEIKLDLIELTLSFIINGWDRGNKNKVFDIKHGEYRAALTMGVKGDAFQLVTYWQED